MNTHKTNGKLPNGIYNQMMLMNDNIFKNKISKEILDKIWKEATPTTTKELDFLTLFGTPGIQIDLVMNERYYNPDNI